MAAHANAVIVLDGMTVESALQKLKKAMLARGIYKEMKARVFYEKPSVKKKRKQTEARKKIAKRMRPMREADLLAERGIL